MSPQATGPFFAAKPWPAGTVASTWIAADGRAAIARSGEAALVLSRMGNGYVARRIAWATAAAAPLKDGRVRLALADFAAPRIDLAMAAWPPKEFAA